MQIIIYILILIFLVSPAISNNLNYSKEYTIEFSSKNIKLKKEETINLIKKQSFKKIINSYLTSDSYNNIIKNINIDLINTFIYGIEIYEEKINNNNYFSKLKIAYDNSKIINYFINNNINYVSYEPEKFLIIIFDQKLFSEKILSKDNLFYEYLNENKFKYNYFEIPRLDINDRFIIKKEDLLTKKIKNYNQLKKKYQNENILLIHSISDSNGVEIFSYVLEKNNFNLIDNSFFYKINYKLFFDDLHNKILDYWKKNNIVITSITDKIVCNFQTINLIELNKIKEIISNNDMIKEINAIKISFNNSIYELTYFGNLDILIKSLNKNKVHLEITDNLCEIKII